ncbi:MAG: hypothetical protein COZ47_11465 [Lysobacterales bacterium CG_4_10_14_3_um_filter_64_11]|nr:MAG: hypothetical protein COZ47_11465 [Xanthomonadales bacterium CG_4_10_14_3_um_filter_64_11]
MCQHDLPWRVLRRDDAEAAPRRFGLAWPRSYCPYCGVQLRSNFRSLAAGLLLTGSAMTLFGINIIASGPWPQRLVTAALLGLLLAAPLAWRLHRYVVVSAHNPMTER